MNWMKNWEQGKEGREDELAGRVLSHDEQEALRKIHENGEKLHAREERDAEIEEYRAEIRIAEEYIDVGFWNKALEILKKIIDNPKLTREDQSRVEALYAEAREMMDTAAALHPDDVEKFGHFNLPTNDVN